MCIEVDFKIRIQSDDEGWSYGEEDAGNLESDEDPLVVDMYSGDSDEPMEEEESDHISDSEDEEEDDEASTSSPSSD